ncbi:MAG: hypothetical protein LBG74_04890 [Spirochaetaceae bacterium]|jgi:hypothetical protein|nr:hypothetical protein [Spirochaetaceae bacterium]
MQKNLSPFEQDILYAIIALHENKPVSRSIRDWFAAFDGTLDKYKRFVLVTPSANSVRLFYNKAALHQRDMPREQFKSMCAGIKERLLQISNLIIKLAEETLIIPEYKSPHYIQPTHEQSLPWRVYNEFFPNEAPPILYVKSLNPIPTKELYKLLEASGK